MLVLRVLCHIGRTTSTSVPIVGAKPAHARHVWGGLVFPRPRIQRVLTLSPKSGFRVVDIKAMRFPLLEVRSWQEAKSNLVTVALGKDDRIAWCWTSSLAHHAALPDHGVGLDGQSCSCLIVGWPVGLSSPTHGVGHDVPQSKELDHQEDQDIPTEVHRPSRTDQQGRAVYRIDPRTDGKKLRLDPRPISRTDCTRSSLSRTTHQSQTDGQARSTLGRAGQRTGRDFSLLAHLEHTGRMDELIDQFDQFMDFDHPNLSKAQILHLSEDLGRLWSKMARKMDKSERTDQPATVLILTAVQPAGHKPAEGSF
ncbi:hypothetical protein DY000_02048257 [Brassica cretica]|uniref:Uncharacterized protein n=1 Tax=Brassica cretica TaxID=69181 RepID=A0ABQ7EWN7_BRACR|nr:hypothetical protein DY000_02048257 [Brassica cretica]